jgi:hypothetical protein
LNYESAYHALPDAFQSGEQAILAEAITAAFDDTIAQWRELIQNYEATILDPMGIDASLLDWLASIGLWRTLWQSGWDAQAKRLLLRDQAQIFQQRYTPACITLLFAHFKLAARVEPQKGLILGVTLLPATIGTGLADYKIRVPRFYQIGTRERSLTEWIVQNFGMPIAIAIEFEV